jgi:spiro-SPASM protein
MKNLVVLYGGCLSPEAFLPVFSGGSAFDLAIEGVRRFPGTEKIVFLGKEGGQYPLPPGVRPVLRDAWTVGSLLRALAELSQGFDCTAYAWADCPFPDAVLTGNLLERHLRYRAEYSYADGWPYGLAPELLSPGTAGILSKIAGDDGAGPVERDSVFSVLRKDINAFDIETEISPVDLRPYRISLAADSRRNLLLLSRFYEAGAVTAEASEKLILERPELLRTLPAFFAVQTSGPCPQSCAFCPYPRFGGGAGGGGGFLEPARFEALLDRICAFCGDAVIDVSLWGELALHPRKLDLVRAVLARPGLSGIVETSGVGWKRGELETLASEAAEALPRKNRMAPLSWIVSLDAQDSGRYKEIRGPGYGEAAECARVLFSLFPGDLYVQAVRVEGAEDDIEAFYRTWKDAGARIIIQKYDDFCGLLPKRQASDLSPVKRRPCWHLMRDVAVFLDGRVPLCRECVGEERLGAFCLGNVYTDSLEELWSRGETFYREQCGPSPSYTKLCAGCDEYYTYNF